MTPASVLADPFLLAWIGNASILAFGLWKAAHSAYRAKRADVATRTALRA